MARLGVRALEGRQGNRLGHHRPVGGQMSPLSCPQLHSSTCPQPRKLAPSLHALVFWAAGERNWLICLERGGWVCVQKTQQTASCKNSPPVPLPPAPSRFHGARSVQAEPLPGRLPRGTPRKALIGASSAPRLWPDFKRVDTFT